MSCTPAAPQPLSVSSYEQDLRLHMLPSTELCRGRKGRSVGSMVHNLCTKTKRNKENQTWEGPWSENTECLGRGWRKILLHFLKKLCFSDTEDEALKLSKDAKYYREAANAETVVSLWTPPYYRHGSIKTAEALTSAWELQDNLVWSYSQTLSIFLSLHSHLWLLT